MTKLKKLSKRGLALFVALLMCLGMLNLTAFADEGSEPGEMAEDSFIDIIEDENNADINEDTIIDNAAGDADVENSNVENDTDNEENDADVEDGSAEDDANVKDGSAGDDTDVEDGSVEDDANAEDGSAEDDANVEDGSAGDDANVEDGDAEDTDPAESDLIEDETLSADLISEAVQAFLAAVAELPGTVTKENAKDVLAQVEACYAAYEALDPADYAHEDVAAALAQLMGLMEEAETLDTQENDVIIVTTKAEFKDAIQVEGAVIDVQANLSDITAPVFTKPVTITSSNGSTITNSSYTSTNGWDLIKVSANVVVKGIDIVAPITVSGIVGGSLTIDEGATVGKVKIEGGGKFTMEEGSAAHGVTLSAGTFNLNGGSSGTVTVNGGTFNLNGGKSGRVTLNAGAFNMDGGEISGNIGTATAPLYGGGVYITGGTFTMNDGAISNNTIAVKISSSYDCGGAGVFVKAGSFTMNGGTISGNKATGTGDLGGGVYVGPSAAFTMNNGTISGNSAPYGGGVYVKSGGTFHMNGGAITENKTSGNGGGVYVDGTINISGNVNIINNTKSTAAAPTNNIYLPSGKSVNVTSELSGEAQIGITPAGTTTGTVVATGAVTEADEAKFTLDTGTFDVQFVQPEGGNANLQLYKAPEARYTAPDGTTQDGDFLVMMNLANSPTGGTVTLLRNVTVTTTTTLFPIENTLTLDLNGQTLDLNGKYIKVGNYSGTAATGYTFYKGNLTLTDSSASGDGKITGGVGYKGYGGAVYLYNGSFTMDGGTISGNSTASYGGAVYVGKNMSFTMNGGTIEANTAPYGGGVAVYGGTFTMNGGTIANHENARYGGGVYVSNSGTFTMNGGTISGNTASNGGGILIQTTAKGYIYGGNIVNNVAHCNYTSDETIYPYGGGGIYVNGGKSDGVNGELYLYNVEITNNTANTGGSEKYNGGAGIANCPTSSVEVYLSSGGAIYGNSASSAISQVFVDGKNTEHHVFLSGYMLGGAPYNWTDENGNALAKVGEWQTLTSAEKINAYNTVSSIPTGLAKVVISGNQSACYGGGIGSNGNVYIGSDLGVLTLSKTVSGPASEDSFNFTITLTNADGSVYNGAVVVNGEAGNLVDGKLNVTLKAGETVVLSNLEVGTQYMIAEGENGADSTNITVNGEAANEAIGTITAESKGIEKVVFTNIYTEKPNTTSLTVNKVWSDGADAHVNGSVTVNILSNGEVVRTVVLNAENGWTTTVGGLAIDQTYTVEEVAVEGYTSSVVTNADGSVTITNTANPPENPGNPSSSTTSLTVNKVWVGDGDIERPATVTVQLYRNGSAYGNAITLSESNGWSYTWSSLSGSYTWTVGEIDVPEGYTSSVSQRGTTVTITNTYEEDTEISEEEPPLSEIPEEDTPLADVPEEIQEPEELAELPDEDPPLADVPETGDNSALWLLMAGLAGAGVAGIILTGKKREDCAL